MKMMPAARSLSIYLLLFVALLCASADVRAQACDNSDSKIVSDIYGRIKGDKGLAPQVSHINIVSLYGAVKLQGWTDVTKDYDRLMSIVFNTSCVRLVNPYSLSSTPPPPESPTRAGNGCGTGTKACGDVCIPEGDSCNIGTMN